MRRLRAPVSGAKRPNERAHEGAEATEIIRDLECRFTIAGRRYHVHVGRDDAPATPYLVREDFDVAIFAGPKGNFDGDEPRKVALDVVEEVVKLMPTKPTPEELDKFHKAVLDWVMRHRGAAVLADHQG